MKRTWKPRETKSPTDLTDTQWPIPKPLLRKRPHDFPPWKAVCQIFFRWRTGGLWERLHDTLRKRVRQNAGKRPAPTAAIIGSQSVKTAEAGGDQRGDDAGK